MNRKHEGISCDFCHKSGFSLRRYKCLLCFDYDLCGPCFDYKRESNNHHNDHPMQCLLTKYDYGTFYAGEAQTDLAFSYTCPICGRLGHNILTLKEHLNQEHNDSNLEVICPICTSLSDGNANQQTRNLGYHISTKHNGLLSSENQDNSPKLTRRFSKQSKITTEAAANSQTVTGRSRKTIQPNSSTSLVGDISNPSNVSAQTFSSGNIFTTNDQGSLASSEEPLLHTLLNHLYTWRTRRENSTAVSKATFGITDSKALSDTSNDVTNTTTQLLSRMPTQLSDPGNAIQSGSTLSRSSTIRSTIQDRNKNIRRKLGTRHIIDLTGDNWRLLDPDNDLFSFDDDDLENISLTLNQASIQAGDVDDSEYMDDEEDIASLIPWGQDLGPESIFSQLRAIVDPKTTLSSSNNSFIRPSGTMASISNIGINSLVNLPGTTIVPGFETPDFKLPHNVEPPTSCDFVMDGDKIASVSLDEHLGQQGLFIRDINQINQQMTVDEPNSTQSQRSHFVRDLILSTFISRPDSSSDLYHSEEAAAENSTNTDSSSLKDLFHNNILDN